jgi:hypothetical protein
MDQKEAHAVANRFLQNKPLVELYDSVLIPALALVERDRHQGNLDDARCNFFFLSIGELIAELTDYRQKEPDNPSPNKPYLSRLKVQEFAVVCISASDQADELTSLMLVQLMERANHQTVLLNATVSSEILDSLATERSTVVFISALPPFAFSQARSLCQRVRSHMPHNRIVIGLWNPTEDPETAELTIERFGSGKPDIIVNTLAQALMQIARWTQPTSNPSIRM